MTKKKQTPLAQRDYGTTQNLSIVYVTPHRITNSSSKAPYEGRELHPYGGRPGAMDAFKLPSRGF
jgi:hypothetical protein